MLIFGVSKDKCTIPTTYETASGLLSSHSNGRITHLYFLGMRAQIGLRGHRANRKNKGQEERPA